MLQWKQRLYAFLLRRVLGPYLSPSSNEKLHESVDVSFQEGKFTLIDVDLNAEHITTLISQKRRRKRRDDDNNNNNNNSRHNIAIRRARIKKLEINLSLEEHNQNETSNTSGDSSTSSSVAWRAMQLGYDTTSSSPRVSLVAHIEIDGIEIDIEPGEEEEPEEENEVVEANPSTTATDTDTQQSISSKSYISSYVDAALSSLCLSFQMNNLSIRFIGSSSSSSSKNEDFAAPNDTTSASFISSQKEQWIELKLTRASYHDVKVDRNNINSSKMIKSKYETVAKKVVDFEGISIHTGERETQQIQVEEKQTKSKSKSSIMGRTEGSGQILYRLIAYNSDVSGNNIKSDKEKDADKPQPKQERAQQDVEISLNQQLHISVDRTSLGRSIVVLKCFEEASPKKKKKSRQPGDSSGSSTINKKGSAPAETTMLGGIKEDEEEAAMLINEIEQQQEGNMTYAEKGLMQQYFEARHLAETNQVRGGILVPTTAYENDGSRNGEDYQNPETIEFDTFFDANDSFAHYKSVLEESIMETTKLIDDDGNESDDFVHTKIKFYLLGGDIKLGFGGSLSPPEQQQQHHNLPPAVEEYVLLTIGDINLSSSLSCRSSDFEASVSHFLLEDSIVIGGRAEIGTMLRFQEVVDTNQNDDLFVSALVSEAPCVCVRVSMHSKHGNDYNVNLEPFEIVNRKETTSCLMNFVEQIKNSAASVVHNSEEMEEERPNFSSSERDSIHNTIANNYNFTCPSITVTLAVCNDDTRIDDVLFDRCGYTLQNVPVTPRPTLGIIFDDISATVKKNPPQQKGEDSISGENSSDDCQLGGYDDDIELSFNHAIFFVTSPCTGRFQIISGMKRIDILALSGRVEVEPYVPVSIRYRRLRPNNNNTDNNKLNYARKTFPVVPSLSSFKARQEDDDDKEQEIESMYRSINMSATKMPDTLRGSSDPQKAMLSACDKCIAVIEINVPDIIADLTRSEVHALLPVIHDATATKTKNDGTGGPNEDGGDGSSVKSQNSFVSPPQYELERIGISISLDQVCLCVHDSLDEEDNDVANSNQQWYSYSIIGDSWKAHALLDNSKIQSMRILAHEANFFEVKNLVQSKAVDENDLIFSVSDRFKRVRERNVGHSSSLATPIAYRSRLFTPMSSDSPVFLFDAVSPSEPGSEENFSEWNLHVTVYSMTFRHDVDSGWLERFTTICKSQETPQSESNKKDSPIVPLEEKAVVREMKSSLTRLIINLADCNLDYTSSNNFKTASRTIVRFGDIHLSSNLVSPGGRIQAYKFSINDVNIHICNERYPYASEDSRITGVSIFTNSGRQTATQQVQLCSNLAPETVLQQMNFITIVSLDSLDGLLAVARANDSTKVLTQNEARTTLTLSAGCLYLYACKDSMACFNETIGELVTKLTALSEEDVAALKAKCNNSKQVQPQNVSDTTFDSNTTNETRTTSNSGDVSHLENMEILSPVLNNEEGHIKENMADQILDPESPIIIAEPSPNEAEDDFLLDGYDWTAIEAEGTGIDIPPGEEQVARWYTDSGNDKLAYSVDSHGSWAKQNKVKPPDLNINPMHIPLTPVSDPLSQGDMDAPKFAGTDKDLLVQTRIIVKDFSLRCRCFDGFDWPKSTEAKLIDDDKKKLDFVIESHQQSVTKRKKNIQSRWEEDKKITASEITKLDRKAKLLGDLLNEDGLGGNDKQKTFGDIPLPEERGAMLVELAEQRKLARRTNRFFQLSLTGLQARVDSLAESPHHRLASCVSIDVKDVFLAETLSGPKPVKMLGEWVSEVEHPRDSNDGFIMMKMETWHPVCRVSDDDDILSDDSQAELKLLPLRCHIDQRAMRFISAYFSSGREEDDENLDDEEDFLSAHKLKVVPPMRFESFKVKPVKLKVNYRPQKINVEALRDGAYVELINLSPLQDMVITLQAVTMADHVGFGPVFKELISKWIGDVIETQMHKFVTNAAPFRPFTSVGGGFADLFVLPWEAIRKGESVHRAFRSGAHSFAGTFAYEVLNTSSILTQSAAAQLSTALTTHSNYVSQNIPLPTRPNETPIIGLGVSGSGAGGDVSGHAVKSLAHGIHTANYKVIIVPYREYQRSGTVGAVRSVIRGIPVALMAPIGGATEAASYALLGARNRIRPDIRKEEEETLSGLAATKLL